MVHILTRCQPDANLCRLIFGRLHRESNSRRATQNLLCSDFIRNADQHGLEFQPNGRDWSGIQSQSLFQHPAERREDLIALLFLPFNLTHLVADPFNHLFIGTAIRITFVEDLPEFGY